MVNSCPWDQYPKDPFPFCEEQICHIIGQPANTWSNIGYFIAAWMIWRAVGQKEKRYTFAAVTLYLAIGSTLFHMSGAMWAKIFDVSAMILLSSLCMSLSLQKILKWKTLTQVLFFLAISAMAFPTVGQGKLGGYVFVAEVVFTMVLEIKMRSRIKAESWHQLKQVMITFPTALVLNMMDQHGPLCWPSNHVFTVHGLWHLLSAFCIYRIYQFYCA